MISLFLLENIILTDKEKVKQEIIDIYMKYNPTKVAEVDQLISKNIGNELQLLERIKNKYLPANIEDQLVFPTENSFGSRVFMEFSVDGILLGRVRFLLYDNNAPLTVANFKCLCTGEKVFRLHIFFISFLIKFLRVYAQAREFR